MMKAEFAEINIEIKKEMGILGLYFITHCMCQRLSVWATYTN